jgi:hypothetical protein
MLQIFFGYTDAWSLNFSEDEVHAYRPNFEFAKWHICSPHYHDLGNNFLLLQILFKRLEKAASVEKTIEDCEDKVQV